MVSGVWGPYYYIMAGAAKANGGAEAGDASADDGYLEGHCGGVDGRLFIVEGKEVNVRQNKEVGDKESATPRRVYL